MVGLFCLFLALGVKAQDISGGHVFVNGETVTAATMNSIVGGAVINSGFYTAKSAETVPADADVLLLYSPSLGGFRQITFTNAIIANQELVAILFNTPDFVRRSNFLAGVDTIAVSNFLGLATSGTISNFLNAATTGARSNFVLQFWSYAPPITNLPPYTNSTLASPSSPTNADVFLVWNSTSNLMQTVSGAKLMPNLWQTFINLPNYTNSASQSTSSPTNGDQFLVFNTTSNLAQVVSGANLMANLWQTKPLFTSPAFTLTNQLAVNLPHGLSNRPVWMRVVLTNQVAELGFSVGDESDAGGCYRSDNLARYFTWGSNATNYWLVGETDGAIGSLGNKLTGAGGAATAANWKIKAYVSSQ